MKFSTFNPGSNGICSLCERHLAPALCHPSAQEGRHTMPQGPVYKGWLLHHALYTIPVLFLEGFLAAS